MKKVRITLDSKLVEALDRAARKLRMTRSALITQALKSAIKDVRVKARVRELEAKQRDGYRRNPVIPGEFIDCEAHGVRRRKPGALSGKVRGKKNFDAPLPEEILAAFEGKCS